MIDHTFSFCLDGLITLFLPQVSFPQFLVKKGNPSLSVVKAMETAAFWRGETRFARALGRSP
jgi:hypothetical protein